MFVWKGPLRDVKWPKYHVPTVDLPIELWGSSRKSRLSRLIPQESQFQFKEFVDPSQVPLWTVWGPEINVYSTSELTIKFFSECAATGWALMIRVVEQLHAEGEDKDNTDSVISNSTQGQSDPPVIDHVVFYSVNDVTDPKWHICARPLVLAYSEGPSTFTFTPAPIAESRPSTPDIASGSTISSTRALQQTVLGALRLRGVRSDNPDFKQLYHVCFRATEFALRNHSRPISLETIREKVESLLTVLGT